MSRETWRGDSGFPVVCLVALVMLVAAPAYPAWEFGSAVSSEIYALESSEGDATATRDTFFTVTPSIVAASVTRRFELDASAEARYRRSFDDSGSEVEPALRLGALGVLIENRLDLEASIASDFRDTSPIGLGDRLGGNEPDFRRTDTLLVGPSYRQVLGGRTRVEAGYRFGVIRVDDEALSGSQSHVGEARAETILDEGGRLRLASELAVDRVEAEEGGTITQGLAQIGVERTLTDAIAVRATVGRDRLVTDDDLGVVAADGTDPTSVEELDTSETIYGVGLRWDPRPYLSLDASWIDRSFGYSPDVSLAFEGRRTSLELAWRRGLRIDRSVAPLRGRGTIDLIGGDDTGGETGAETAAEIADDAMPLPLARDLTSVDETIILTGVLAGRTLDVTVDVAHVRRERLSDDVFLSESTSVGLLVNRRIGRRLSVSFSARHQREKDRERLVLDPSVPPRGDAPTTAAQSDAVRETTRLGIQLTLDFS